MIKNVDNFLLSIKNEALYYLKKYDDVRQDIKQCNFDKYTDVDKTLDRYQHLSEIYTEKYKNLEKLKIRFWPNRRFVYFRLPSYFLKQQLNGNFLTLIKGLHFQIKSDNCKMMKQNNSFLVCLDVFEEYETQEHEIGLWGGEIYDLFKKINSIEEIKK